jgi:hypothetical protein
MISIKVYCNMHLKKLTMLMLNMTLHFSSFIIQKLAIMVVQISIHLSLFSLVKPLKEISKI